MLAVVRADREFMYAMTLSAAANRSRRTLSGSSSSWRASWVRGLLFEVLELKSFVMAFSWERWC
jgi:hypothetical protein